MLTRSLLSLSKVVLRPTQGISFIAPTFSNFNPAVKHFSTTDKNDTDDDYVPIEELVKTIDTKLTPEQKEYVNKLKKKLKGANSPRSLYRDVPRPEEVQGTGNYMPLIAENAEELIDWALSHIPKRDGPRRHRYKNRMQLRQVQRLHDHARRKEQTSKAQEKKQEKLKRIKTEIEVIKLQAIEINTKRDQNKV